MEARPQKKGLLMAANPQPAQFSSQTRANQLRIGQFRNGHTKGHEEPLNKWSLLALWVEGFTLDEIGEKLERSRNAVCTAARRLGLTGWASVYSFGERFDFQAVFNLRTACDLTPAMFAKLTDVSPEMVRHCSPRLRNQRVPPKAAAKIIRWRDALISRVLSTKWTKTDYLPADLTTDERRYSQPALMRALFPQLKERYEFLVRVFNDCRKPLEFSDKQLFRLQPSATVEELGEYFCQRAQFEIAANVPDKVFARFLPWAPELVPFLAPSLHRITGRRPLGSLVLEALAWHWKVPAGPMRLIVHRKIEPIPPARMRALLHSLRNTEVSSGLAAEVTEEEEKRDRGRPSRQITPVIRARVKELRRIKDLRPEHSWGEVRQMCNREFKKNYSKSYYRWLDESF